MDQARENDLMGMRRVVQEEIENFVKATEQKITDAGFTPFEMGFTAVKDKPVFNDFTCAWDIAIEYLGPKKQDGRKPLPWINSEKYEDYPHIRTNRDALRAVSNIGPYVDLQVDALMLIYDICVDDIWCELDDPVKEQFSRLTINFRNCIEKLKEHADEIEQLPSILCRNQQRIALGMDKKGAA